MRRGFALSVTLFALVLLAALASGAFVAAVQETAIAKNTAGSVRASMAARSAVRAAFTQWSPGIMDALPVGASALVATGASPGASWRVDARRVGELFYLLTARGDDSAGTGERVARLVGRLEPLVLGIPAAVRVRASPTAALAARLSGVDEAPAGWTCGPTGDPVPAVLVDSVAPLEQFYTFGTRSWADLESWALIVPGGDSLILALAPGDTAVLGGSSSGILLVGGSLRVGGGWRFRGVVIVRGEVVFEGGGGEVLGALVGDAVRMAAGVPTSAVRVVHSSCAVGQASLSRAPLRTIPGHPLAWVF